VNTTINITRRDDYIESQALVLAIGYIQSLPRKQQQWSNMNDMCKIARAKFYPTAIADHVATLYFSTSALITLFPDDEDDTIDLDWKADFDRIVSNMIEQRESLTRNH
jgi:hypothetical protein